MWEVFTLGKSLQCEGKLSNTLTLHLSHFHQLSKELRAIPANLDWTLVPNLILKLNFVLYGLLQKLCQVTLRTDSHPLSSTSVIVYCEVLESRDCTSLTGTTGTAPLHKVLSRCLLDDVMSIGDWVLLCNLGNFQNHSELNFLYVYHIGLWWKSNKGVDNTTPNPCLVQSRHYRYPCASLPPSLFSPPPSYCSFNYHCNLKAKHRTPILSSVLSQLLPSFSVVSPLVSLISFLSFLLFPCTQHSAQPILSPLTFLKLNRNIRSL